MLLKRPFIGQLGGSNRLPSAQRLSFSLRRWKSTAPPLHYRWFYAIDVPLTMPEEYKYTKTQDAKKFSPFQERDSIRLEQAYKKLLKKKDGGDGCYRVAVNEDYLFEVDLTKRQMSPVYWDGATYETRRGSWYDDQGQPLREELAEELEKGYLKMKPFDKKTEEITTDSKTTATSIENPLNKQKDEYYELQGEHEEGKIVVYTEDRTAHILKELIGGKLQLNLLKKLESGPSLGSMRVYRGFKKATREKNQKDNDSKSHSMSNLFEMELTQLFGEKTGLINNVPTNNEPEMNAMEYEIEQDYNTDTNTDDDGRQIDHLIFCIHGIGQVLGTKFQGVNFVHTVNVLRKNIKTVYEQNKDLQSLLKDDKNCRIQVLPITWRHKVNFKADEAPEDQLDARGEKRLPSLLDITVDEIKPIRNLLGSVLLDVLLYYEPRYLNQILDEVVRQANTIYSLFKERNPNFNGKVSFIGHSLGSAIAFDILSCQPTHPTAEDLANPKHLSFPVENYFAIGSPIGVFNLLKQKNIGSRALNGESTDQISTPKVKNFYNIFHPCDPVGYRCEPLISTEFKKFQPESMPFLIEDFNKQISSIAEYGESFHSKVINNANDVWNSLTSNVTGSIDLSKLWKLVDNEESKKNPQVEMKDPTSDSKDQPATATTVTLTETQLEKLTNLNYNGRVDYALRQGLFDLSIVSSISAHVSYFEDENTAAFILKETLTNQERVKEKKVRLLKSTTEQ